MQTGRLPPPSEEVSRALAEVLEGNADELVLAGYLEKAPAIVHQKLQEKNMPVRPNNTASDQDILFFRRMGKLSQTSREKIMRELEWLETLERNLAEKKKKE